MPWKFLKAQASSIIATGVDFLVVILLSEFSGGWSVGTNMTGTLAGGMTNFLLNRQWVFGKENGTFGWQAFKYLVVWTGNLLLNAAGVWLLVHYTDWSYIVVKMMISVLLGVGYSYVMQKRFVFK